MHFPAQADKWLIVRAGQRGGDPWVAVHFGHFRFCFDGNVSHLRGAMKLERLTLEPQYRPRKFYANDERMYADEKMFERGVILFAIEWRRVYVVQRRPMWTPENYFIHADKLMKENGIDQP